MLHYRPILYLIPIILICLMSCSTRDTTDEDSAQSEILYIADVTSRLNVRESPSADSRVLGYYLPGDTAHVVNIDGEWAEVLSRYDEIGYVRLDLLRPVITEEAGVQTMPDALPPHDAASRAGLPSRHFFTIIDSCRVLSQAECAALTQLPLILDRPVIVYATDSVPTNKIRSFAKDTRENLVEGEYESMADSVSIFTWIAASRLLQCADDSNEADYMSIVWPERYFATQQLAQTDGVATGAIAMTSLLEESARKYADMNWFMRTNFSKETYVEAICDTFIASNILPNDTFWHKWVLGWIFKYPLAVASWIYSFTGSLVLSLCLVGFMIITAGLSIELYSQTKLHNFENAMLGVAIAYKIFSAIAWLVMISFVVYMFPDMSTISIAENSNMPQTAISGLYHQFALPPINTGILSAIIFTLLMILVGGINRKYIIYSTLSEDKQKLLYQKERKEIERELLIDNMFSAAEGQVVDTDTTKLDRSDTPYTDLSVNSFSQNITKTTLPAIVLAVILNGSLMVFAIIFLSLRLARHVIYIVSGIVALHRNHAYA